MKKNIIIILLVYIASGFAITSYIDKFNALTILCVSFLQIAISILLVFLQRNTNKRQLKIVSITNIILFSLYSIFQNFIVLTGKSLEKVIDNSAFVNSSNIIETMDNPGRNTITGIIIIILLHWIILRNCKNGKEN
ncbi:MAG: hypothetical protein HXL80_01665 [[Eubacterium] sulci]|nr:hypothetical protein [[Eubacterium] sulci]